MDKGAISRCSSFLVKTFGIEGELNYYFEREDSNKNSYKLHHGIRRHTNHQCHMFFLRIEKHRICKYILKLPSINQRLLYA